MSDSDIDQKIGKDNLARMERLGIEFHQNDPRNADNYEYVGVSSRGTPVWLHKEVAACDVKITIGQAQSNHWGAGGGGKLILPGVVSDETIESNHCAFVPVAADPLRRVRGADALGHRRGRDDVRPLRDDERRPRHARPRGRVHLRLAPRRASQGDRALQRDLRVRAPGNAGRHRDLRRLRADRPPLLPHGLGLHVGRLRREGRRLDHLLLARHRVSRPRSATSPVRAHGSHEAVHAGDAARTTSRCSRTSTRVRSRCGPAASGSRSTRS